MSADELFNDAEALDRAARVLLRDSGRKHSIVLAVIRKLLTGHAEKLRRRARS